MNFALFARSWVSSVEAAHAYAEAGMPVFPVNARKEPLVPRGFYAASRDPVVIDGWWKKFPAANIGLPTGIKTAIVIVDVDDIAVLEILRGKYGAIPKTFTVATPRGGLHYYFQHPLRVKIQSPQNALCQKVDIRADGAYVLIPPSIINLNSYTVKANMELAPLPGSIYKKLTDRGNVSESSEDISDRSDHSEFSEPSDTSCPLSLEDILTRTLPKHQGERHRSILNLARGLKLDLGMAGHPLCEIKPIVRRWHDMALPTIRTKDFDSTWSDFIDAWKHARFPLSMDVPLVAIEKAKAGDLPPEAEQYDSEDTRLLVGMCYHLSRGNDIGNFFLSSHTPVALLGKNQPFIYRRLQMLVSDGVLRVREPGNERRATRYQWIGSGGRTKRGTN